MFSDPAGSLFASPSETVERHEHDDPGGKEWLLWCAVAAVVFGIAAFFVWNTLLGHFIGYLACSLIGFTLIAIFRQMSVRRLNLVGIALSPGRKRISRAVLVFGFLASVLHAWFVARHFG
jgi:hypothetical protein